MLLVFIALVGGVWSGITWSFFFDILANVCGIAYKLCTNYQARNFVSPLLSIHVTGVYLWSITSLFSTWTEAMDHQGLIPA